MTHEEAARILDPEEREQALLEYDSYDRLSKLEEACRIAAKALRNSQPDCNNVATSCTPLTLEQLREMDGRPVYLDIFQNSAGNGCRIIESVTDKKILLRGKNVTYVPTLDIGKKYNLYAYPPARIDREAWEPCEECGDKSCDNCRYSEYLSIMEPCKFCENVIEWKPAQNFCGECGRPLTEEAWAELEKRLRGGEGVKCENCKKYEDCKIGSGLTWPCGAYAPKIVTNADRIRAMSDEELTNFCRKVSRCAGCPPPNDVECEDNCEKCWEIYLRRPTEED